MKYTILVLCYLCLVTVSCQQERRRRIKKKIIVPSNEAATTPEAVTERQEENLENQEKIPEADNRPKEPRG